jgi:hypothetical protein
MARSILIVASTFLFTVLGLVTGIALLLTLPKDFYDPEGFQRGVMMMLPLAGGGVFGLIVGAIAASFWPVR